MSRFLSGTLAVVLTAVLASAAHAQTGPLVRTRQGWVQGLTVGNVDQFRGLPYATPPLGELRWRAPLPPAALSGVRSATAFPAPCIQSRVTAGLPLPSEDCLYLNVYRPAGSTERKRMPVLVYIHGGGFGAGTGSTIDGTPLASTQDMVVVTLNYRLGALGWLALDGLDAETRSGSSSGNYGFLDMLAALRWVRDNIGAFGGDEHNVTIAGTSAGGIAVCTLMTAPIHERLFHRAAIESGECTTTSAFIISHRAALLQGAQIAAKAGCADPASFTSCLRAASTANLLAASTGVGQITANVGGHLLPQHPLQAFASGELDEIPVIVGAQHDELRSSPIATTGFPATLDGYQTYLANAFGVLAPLVAAQYPAAAFADPVYAAGAAASDSGIPSGIGVCPMLMEQGTVLSRVTRTFAYEMNDPTGGALSAVPAGFVVGSEHASEINFLYAQLAATRTDGEREMGARMLRYWGTFARTGHPEGALPWKALTSRSTNVIRFQPTEDVLVPFATMSDEHHCTFWSQVGY
ncbi:MAG TPA: carboxylesterase family protein [Myxococcales bacterium]|nr:carboxylesterase family protein [Myxococcales bacterium]